MERETVSYEYIKGLTFRNNIEVKTDGTTLYMQTQVGKHPFYKVARGKVVLFSSQSVRESLEHFNNL